MSTEAQEEQQDTIARLQQQLSEAVSLQQRLTTTTPGSSSSEIEEVRIPAHVKLPVFWQRDPTLWFAQVEAQFHSFKIRSDTSKYYTVVAALDCSILQSVSDIIAKPPDNNKYEAIKQKLISTYTDSQEKQLRKLLNEMELGDKKPSQLQLEMKKLAGTQINSEVLKTLWLQHLPLNVQLVLSASEDVELDKMTKIADKLVELHTTGTTGSNAIAAVDNSTQSSIASDNTVSLELMQKQISMLTKMVESLASDKWKNRHRRQRSRSRSVNRSQPKGQCFYHSRFGDKARKCVLPCNFKANTSSSSSGN